MFFTLIFVNCHLYRVSFSALMPGLNLTNKKGKIMKKIISMLFGVILVASFASNANAKTLKCQTVLNTKADEVKMLKDFTDTVTELTSGSLKFEILPAGAVVGVKETLDAVIKD